MEVLTRKLHEAVKEIEPTQEEWLRAILFLTGTGHMCNDWRQEFILLSDVLGVSMLVDAINNRSRPAPPNPPCSARSMSPTRRELPMGANICLDAKGEDMVISGRVLDTAGNPIAGAVLDVWQANDEGFYDVQQKGIQPDFNLRGVFRTGARRPLLVPRGRSRNSIRSPTTARSGNCSPRSAATPTARRTCISSSRRRVSTRWSPTFSIRMTRISASTRAFGVKESLLANSSASTIRRGRRNSA